MTRSFAIMLAQAVGILAVCWLFVTLIFLIGS